MTDDRSDDDRDRVRCEEDDAKKMMKETVSIRANVRFPKT